MKVFRHLQSVLLFASLSLMGMGCAAIIESTNTAPPGKTVAITLFKSNCDSLLVESVQDAIVDVFFTATNSKPIKGTNGDILVTGIITAGEGSTEHSGGALVATGGAKSGVSAIGGESRSAAAGSYITAITFQAYVDGVLVATYSIGQNLGKGGFVSPVNMAKRGARELSTLLVRKNIIGRP